VRAGYGSPYIFYLKFPRAIVEISYSGDRRLEIISVNNISSKFIDTDDWSVVVGHETLLLYVGGELKEMALRPDSKIQNLHTI
jgi:hypothetical protein